MPQAELTESQRLCLEMIESVYGDGVDAIAQPVVEDGIISVDFQDGIKLLNAKIYPDRETDDIAIKILNPDAIAD